MSTSCSSRWLVRMSVVSRAIMCRQHTPLMKAEGTRGGARAGTSLFRVPFWPLIG